MFVNEVSEGFNLILHIQMMMNVVGTMDRFIAERAGVVIFFQYLTSYLIPDLLLLRCKFIKFHDNIELPPLSPSAVNYPSSVDWEDWQILGIFTPIKNILSIYYPLYIPIIPISQ